MAGYGSIYALLPYDEMDGSRPALPEGVTDHDAVFSGAYVPDALRAVWCLRVRQADTAAAIAALGNACLGGSYEDAMASDALDADTKAGLSPVVWQGDDPASD